MMGRMHKRYRLRQEAKDAYKYITLFFMMLILMGVFTTWLDM